VQWSFSPTSNGGLEGSRFEEKIEGGLVGLAWRSSCSWKAAAGG
jgi:hypothetical protein